MNDAGFFHFLAQADMVAQAVLAALVLMSIASWSSMLFKAYRSLGQVGLRQTFLASYGMAVSPAALERHMRQHPAQEPCGRVASAGFAAWQRWNRRGDNAQGQANGLDDFLDRALHRAVCAERARQEEGLAVLAAVGSTAPFVGLFGTVWGIYHSLLAIGLSGQASLDKVAGPVGEALVMTAIGLAVAIPATLGYNAFVRASRVTLAVVEDFAHDFHAFLVTGVHASALAVPTRESTDQALAEIPG